MKKAALKSECSYRDKDGKLIVKQKEYPKYVTEYIDTIELAGNEEITSMLRRNLLLFYDCVKENEINGLKLDFDIVKYALELDVITIGKMKEGFLRVLTQLDSEQISEDMGQVLSDTAKLLNK